MFRRFLLDESGGEEFDKMAPFIAILTFAAMLLFIYLLGAK